MCESSAYLFKEGKEEILLKDVSTIIPEEDHKWFLTNIFGEQKTIIGKIKEMNFLEHKIIFEEK